MKAQYVIDLLNGEHGVWLFISKNGKVVCEQAGIQSPGQAIDFAKAVILSEEKEEAKKQEAGKVLSPDNSD